MSDPHVYDKAKWHYDGDFPADLDEYQGFVHTGMFVGWLIEHGMITNEFVSETEGFFARELTGAQVYELWDGVLVDEMLTEEGNHFARSYFDFEAGSYLKDYSEILSTGLPSMYHVKDTWPNYERIKDCIDHRYADWKATERA